MVGSIFILILQLCLLPLLTWGHPSAHRPKTPYVSFICWGPAAVVRSYYCKSPSPAALSLVTLGVWEVESAR